MNISLKNVSKKFNEKIVVEDLTFSVKAGQIWGILGPNGAGKTTTLRMILDIFKPDEGEIEFDGIAINGEIRDRIGYLPEERGVYQRYKVIDVLSYLGRLKNMPRRKSTVEAVRLLDRFGMIDVLEDRVSHLSKGMQQKLQYITSIIHDPEFVILDEPFWGLDPINQQAVRDHILSLKQQSKVVLLSTHQLTEAENLCDGILLLNQGKNILHGSMTEIHKKYHDNIIEVESEDDLNKLHGLNFIKKIEIKNGTCYLHVEEDTDLNTILKVIVNRVKVSKFQYAKPSLNDIFLQSLQENRL